MHHCRPRRTRVTCAHTPVAVYVGRSESHPTNGYGHDILVIMNEITIPNYRLVQDVKPHYVYTIKVLSAGYQECVEKRYSAFHAFHREVGGLYDSTTYTTWSAIFAGNYLQMDFWFFFFVQLRKSISTPPFPSKRIRCSQPKVLEQRRAGLERYLQTVFKIEDGCRRVMEFLGLKYHPR